MPLSPAKHFLYTRLTLCSVFWNGQWQTFYGNENDSSKGKIRI